MEIAQEREWAEAQKIAVSLDMVAAVKRHLQFLAAVDQTACLYNGPALLRAIYRYNVCWLPLLAKDAKSPLCEEPLVVPLDCEWVWHCHRLNPLRYISDCKELFGKILDNRRVVSSIEGYSQKKTEEIWSGMFPEEPYELDFAKVVEEDAACKPLHGEKITEYDLVSAVERQSSFYWQVARPHMTHDLFLQESVARYKGFLYLMKKNMEKLAAISCVPTYDIDLIWHTHQLHPFSYCKDLIQLLGRVIEHDDTDSDRSEGNTLNNNFKRTTEQWEDIFGRMYWKAGAMYRGNAPNLSGSQTPILSHEHQKSINAKLVEVLVEFTGVKNIPEGIKKEDLFVSFKKPQPDMFFTKKEGIDLGIQSLSGEKEVALFWCESAGQLQFELKSQNSSSTAKDSKALGSASLSIKEFLDPLSELSSRKWIELAPPTPLSANHEHILLNVAVSFTVPTKVTTQMLHMLQHEASLRRDSRCLTAAGGGACGGCNGNCKGLLAEAAGGGICSNCIAKPKGLSGAGGGVCGSCLGKSEGLSAAAAVGSACGGGGCSGKCKGLAAAVGSACGGGGCSGKCKGLAAAGGGACGCGGCSGKCKGLAAAVGSACGGGGCSGKCKGLAAAGGGACGGGGGCSGKCKGLPAAASVGVN